MTRRDDNRAIKDYDELVTMLVDGRDEVCRILVRNRFTSGQKMHSKGEFGEMEGEVDPHVSDPTCLAALWDERVDLVSEKIVDAARKVHDTRSIVKWIRELSNLDATKMDGQPVPDCPACGDPCTGRVLNGVFDEKCYKRWERAGRPDRDEFIDRIQTKRAEKAKRETKVDARYNRHEESNRSFNGDRVDP